MPDTYDLIVLGSGPGGYVAAIRAAQLGLKTAIVERELLGGICLNWGCIPTKALLRSAEVLHLMKHADAYGLSNDKPSFDIAKVVARSRAVAKQLNQGVTHLMKKNKIAVVMGEGKLTGKGRLSVAGADGKATELTAKHIIVATGARARDLPFAKADGKRIWTYRHAMTPPEMPTELLVIGSGAIGIEFASFYADLGAKVTVVEMLDRVVPVEDAEVSAQLAKSLQKQGLTILTCGGRREPHGRREGRGGEDQDQRRQDRPSTSSAIASSPSGSSPNTENIGLEALGVKTTKGHIDTDPMCRTNVPGIWAIGDVTAPPWLAHKASHEGVTAAEAIAKELGNKDAHPHATDPKNIPGCTYCRPAGRQRRPDRGRGQGKGIRGQGRQIPGDRQRQGDRAGRGRGLREDRVRRQDRRIAGRAHDRRRGHRADPGLHHRQDRRAGRGRFHPHRLPASDLV